MNRYRIGVIGLKMGRQWVDAASRLEALELAVVYDKRPQVTQVVAQTYGAEAAMNEQAFFDTEVDIVVVATPDPVHVPHSLAALEHGRHVICEKPMAATVDECRQLIDAAEQAKGRFMVGQIARYAPGFRTAHYLLKQGEIGELVFIESEYAHDYARVPGVDEWRKDPTIAREGIIGGGCHAMDVVRWMAGDPTEVFAYTNHKCLPDWPTADTGVMIFKAPDDVIGKVFVSTGIKRPYTMRTVLCGTKGTIICDNTSSDIQLFREDIRLQSDANKYTSIPVFTGDLHNDGTRYELEEFIDCLDRNVPPPTDVYEGAKTVAFGHAALRSAREGRAVQIEEVLNLSPAVSKA